MADLTLGMDLGPNSIGWALIDQPGKTILASGVRVFPEGVDRDSSGGEIPKNAQRRLARAARRQTRRRAKRKCTLRRVLVEAGLLPDVATLSREDPRRDAWEREQFRKADPYTLRREALHRPLELHDIGRVLVHLNQRRGFKSNRKTDRERKKEDSEMLQEISDLEAELGDRTLGEFLADLRGGDPATYHLTRLRGRHTRRSMYEREFNRIWSAQREHHRDVLSDELRRRIHRIIFFQRDLLPPSPSLIGRCELEPRLPRAPRADRRVQRFRLFQEVNNLRILDTDTGEERPLDPDERSTLVAYLSAAKYRTFKQLRKKLFAGDESKLFNLERGGRTKLHGMPSDTAMAKKDLIGKAWKAAPEEIKDRIVAAVIDDNETRLRYLLEEAGFDPDLAERLLDNLPLETGYSSYSLHAIKRLLPALERGLPLTSRDPSVACALREAGYLMPWEREVDQERFLPEPPQVTNPLVRAALSEVRKVVNAILREHVYGGGHNVAHIHIELAREVRGTARQREARNRQMRERERRRAAARDELEENGIKATRSAISRYLLWLEQEKLCAYSGRPISFTMLFGGEVDIDHVLPYSRSLDDSLMNKVVCLRSQNVEKDDRTVHEWLAAADPAKYERITQQAKAAGLPYPKIKRLLQPSVELEDFFARQFVDTSYITTQVLEYVRCLGADVLCPKGQHTAELRHRWGLGTILSELPDSPAWREQADLRPGEKNRADYRHHAVDAIVVGLTNRARLQQLARNRRRGADSDFVDPWDGFRASVADSIARINVSHRPQRGVSGQLHEETIYGPTEVEGVVVMRKALEDLTCSMVPHIRDERVRGLVIERLASHGIEPGRGRDRIPKEVWQEPLWMNEAKGIPIRRVRVLKQEKSVRPIRGGTALVKPGKVHHACLFEYEENGTVKRDAVFTTLIEAVDRVRRREDVVRRTHPARPDARFIMSLSGGDTMLAEFDGQERLVVVSTLVTTQRRIHIVDANDARPSAKKKNIGRTPNSLRGTRVVVDPIGQLHPSND